MKDRKIIMLSNTKFIHSNIKKAKLNFRILDHLNNPNFSKLKDSIYDILSVLSILKISINQNSKCFG